MYTESHPHRNVAHAACSTFLFFSNSFTSYSFHTLASHLKASVSSNPFEIKRFRTLCKMPGIGYPPLSLSSPRSFHSFTKECSITLLPPTGSALFFKTAGWMGISNQILKQELVEDSLLLAVASLPAVASTRQVCESRLPRASRGVRSARAFRGIADSGLVGEISTRPKTVVARLTRITSHETRVTDFQCRK